MVFSTFRTLKIYILLITIVRLKNALKGLDLDKNLAKSSWAYFHNKNKRKKKKSSVRDGIRSTPLHCKCLQGIKGSLQVFPVVGKPGNIYRLRGNPIIIMGFPCNL